jgi:hypothetical protein
MINQKTIYLGGRNRFNNEEKQSSKNNWHRATGLIISSLMLTYFIQKNKVEMIEDNQIKNLRKIMSTEESKLRAQFG